MHGPDFGGEVTPGDVSRHHIEIESQADNMLCHKALYTIVIVMRRVCFQSARDAILLIKLV